MARGPETIDDESVGNVSRSSEDTRQVDIESVAAVDAAPGEPPAFEIGAKLGRYVLLRELGRGGMAVVYVAYDPELDRRVALKLVRPRRGSKRSADQERLLREAQALARLSHPNVVHVYDVGIYEAHVYIAMELVQGQTLRVWLGDAPRSWREVLDVCMRAGRGLAAAHAAGLVHLDFKPGNVLLGEDGRVRVVDFGLAREPRGGESGESGIRQRLPAVGSAASLPPTLETLTTSHHRLGEQLTEHGAVMGTPGYIAPEQLRGEQPDARADQFSFCVALWEALFGQRPFLADDRRALEQAVLAGELTEPPAERIVPSWLRRIVERGLSVRADDRFADMNALLAVLGRDPVRARRRGAAVLGLVLAFGGAGFGYYRAVAGEATPCTGSDEKLARVWSADRRAAGRAAFDATALPFAADVWRGAEAAIDDHARAWKGAYVDACEATHVRGEQSAELLDLRMHCLERARTELGALVDVFIDADEAVVRNAVEAVVKLGPLHRCTDAVTLRAEGRPSDPALRDAVDALDIELARAKSSMHAGHVAQALDQALATLGRAEALDYPPLEARVAMGVGSAHSSLGQDELATVALERAVFAAERAGLDMQRAQALIQLAYVVGYLGADYERGKWLLRLAREILHRLGEKGIPLSEVYSNEAVLEAAQGRPDVALTLLREALDIRRRIDGYDKLNVAVLLNNMGGAHFEKGEYEEALRLYREVHELQTAVFGDKHPSACESFENLGNVLHAMGRSEDSLEHHREAISICEAAGVGGGLQHAQRLNNTATVLASLSRYDEAVAHYRKAVELCGHQPDHPTRGIILANMAEAYLGSGESAAALHLFEEGMAIIEKSLGRDQLYFAAAQAGAGHAMVELGRFDEAITALQDALAVLERVTADAQMRAEAEFNLARALVASTDDRETLERARSLVERARATAEHAGDRGVKLLAASKAWLRAHPTPSR